MKHQDSSLKKTAPGFSGLPDAEDYKAIDTQLRDHPKSKPSPQQKRDPKPKHRRDPHPVRHPENYPPQERDLPRMAKKEEKNEYAKDESRKAGFRFSDWHEALPNTLEEHLICGYEKNGKKICHLILGNETQNGALRYTGHVSIEADPLDAFIIASQIKTEEDPFSSSAFMSDNPATWLRYSLACMIECPEKTEGGLLLSPIYRGLKTEKPLLERVLPGIQ